MKENIHLKISSEEKVLLTTKAKKLGLSLNSYIRLILQKEGKPYNIVLRGTISF